MTDERIIATLNELIAASKDGAKDFEIAAKDVQEPELARVFSDGEKTTQAAIVELQDQVRLLGGTAEEEGGMKAAAHRGWTNVMSMVRPRDDRAILEACERGERHVRSRYADALTLDLPGSVRSLVERHHGVIVASHYRVLDLRNRLRDAGARALRAND